MINVLLLAMQRTPVDNLASCTHKLASFFSKYRITDNWRILESIILCRIASYLVDMNIKYTFIDAELDSNTAKMTIKKISYNIKCIVIIELDNILHIPKFNYWVNLVKYYIPKSIFIAAGQIPLLSPHLCYKTFPELSGIIGPNNFGNWHCEIFKCDKYIQKILIGLNNTPVINYSINRTQLNQRIQLTGKSNAVIDHTNQSFIEIKNTIFNFNKCVQNVIFISPLHFSNVINFIISLQTALTTINRKLYISLKLIIDNFNKPDVVIFNKLIIKIGKKHNISRLELIGKTSKFVLLGSDFFSNCVNQGISIQPVVKLISSNMIFSNLVKNFYELRIANIHKYGQPCLMFNGLTIFPEDLDDNGLSWKEHIFSLALNKYPNNSEDKINWINWADDKVAMIWSVLRIILVDIHEKYVNQIPSIILSLRSTNPKLVKIREHRRALLKFRNSLGNIVIDVIDKAITFIIDNPSANKKILIKELNYFLSKIEMNNLGQSFKKMLEENLSPETI